MRIFFASGLVLLALSVPLRSQGSGGHAGAAFRMGFDARSIGMGNAVSGSPGQENASAYNPALLPFLSSPMVSLGGSTLSLDRTLFHVAVSTPLPPTAGLGFSASGARVGDIQGRDANGARTEIYSSNEYAVALSFGLQPAPSFALGVSAKLLHARLLPELTSTTVGLDFGACYLVSDDLAVSVAFRDVNSKYRWDSTPIYGRNGNTSVDRFPNRAVVGFSWSPTTLPVRVGAEAESVSGLLLGRFGVEYAIVPALSVRAGIDGADPGGTIGSRATFGLSVNEMDLPYRPTLDYAFMVEPYAPLGAHFITVRLHLSK